MHRRVHSSFPYLKKTGVWCRYVALSDVIVSMFNYSITLHHPIFSTKTTLHPLAHKPTPSQINLNVPPPTYNQSPSLPTCTAPTGAAASPPRCVELRVDCKRECEGREARPRQSGDESDVVPLVAVLSGLVHRGEMCKFDSLPFDRRVYSTNVHVNVHVHYSFSRHHTTTTQNTARSKKAAPLGAFLIKSFARRLSPAGARAGGTIYTGARVARPAAQRETAYRTIRTRR
jgi:hypothetical protein